MKAQKRYVFENIVNCRDLGGYPSEYGVTQFGRFIRCGTPARPTENDIAALKEMGISAVIDLRGKAEVENQPNDLERLTINTEYISLYELNAAAVKSSKYSLGFIYEIIISESKDNIRKALKTIAAASDGTILYHCFLGKDRTGILTLLLLSIAGVSEDDIVADYQITYTYIESYLKSHTETLWDTDPKNHLSLPQTMRELIAYLNRTYGSVLNYINSLGMNDNEIELIRKRFF